MTCAPDLELKRQQALLQALWRRESPLPAWVQGAHQAGLAVYRANAAAMAERALAQAYPTVAQLVGEEALAHAARACWQAQPPRAGDLGLWGDRLALWIEAQPQLAAEPYLADVARLDWAVHQADRAADGPEGLPGLQRLAHTDPDKLRLQLAPGAWTQSFAYPVVLLWQAHRVDEASADAAFAAARTALAAGSGQTAFVWRQGYAVQVCAVPQPVARFLQAVLTHHSLAAALDAAGPEFDFTYWLEQALRQGQLAAIEEL